MVPIWWRPESSTWSHLHLLDLWLVWLLEFHVLATSKVISGLVLICCSMHSWWLYSVTWKSGYQHHDMISYSVMLSWHWANQSPPYPINAKRQARKWQVSILSRWVDSVWKVSNLNRGRVKPTTYKIDTCRYVAWHSALLGGGKDWLAHYQDNVTGWKLR